MGSGRNSAGFPGLEKSIFAILLFVVGGMVWKWLTVNYHWTSAGHLAYQKHELELEYIRNFNALRLQMFEISIYVLLVIGLAFAMLSAVIFYRKQRDSELRPKDGFYPLVRNRLEGGVVYTNPNALLSSHWMVGQRSEPYQMDSAMALLNEPSQSKMLADKPTRPRRRKVAAQNSPLKANAAPEPVEGGGQFRQRSTELTPKSQPARMRTRLQVDTGRPLVPENPRPRLLSFREALEQSTPEEWILGQNEESGELAYFCPKTDVHGAIVGATGCGKTESSGLMIVLQALLQGYHVILLDGKGGLDWRWLEPYVEWQDMDYALLPQQISALHGLFQARMDLLKEEQASTIHELERPLKPILVLLEEFGATYDSLQVADKQQAQGVAVQMSNMFRLARSTGISFMVIDQAPNMWPKQVRANIKCAICYRLAGRLGQIFNEHNLHKLPKIGYFSLSSAFFKAWHTKAELGQLRVELPHLTERVLLG